MMITSVFRTKHSLNLDSNETGKLTQRNILKKIVIQQEISKDILIYWLIGSVELHTAGLILLGQHCAWDWTQWTVVGSLDVGWPASQRPIFSDLRRHIPNVGFCLDKKQKQVD